MRLPDLFHWSPAGRRESILRDGLIPGSPPVTQSEALEHPFACVCLGPSPAGAWRLSGAMEWTSEVPLWDLWQVLIPDTAEVHVRPMFGRDVEEIKVYSAIPAAQLWWVGVRTGRG